MKAGQIHSATSGFSVCPLSAISPQSRGGGRLLTPRAFGQMSTLLVSAWAGSAAGYIRRRKIVRRATDQAGEPGRAQPPPVAS